MESKASSLGTLAKSCPSGPEIVFSTSTVSSTLRAIGPNLSSDQHNVIAPVRGTRPNVGRSPVTPHRIDGATMLPPVSLPIANPTSPAAVAAPGPALDPEDPSSSSQGFIVCPPNHISLSASAPILNFATSDPPVRPLCLLERRIAHQGNHATQLRVKFLQPRQINLRKPLRADLP